jgi:RNA polymerase sigma-70 factor (ECF subfamily)
MNSKAEQFSKLYLAEHARLEGSLRRKVNCSATASDLVQDIFLRLWERASEYPLITPAYVRRSARNAAIDHARAQRVRQNYAAQILPEQLQAAPSTPFDIVAAQQSAQAALSSLPKVTRHIFLLSRVHGRTFREIADVMQLSERAVARHIERALAVCEVLSTQDDI